MKSNKKGGEIGIGKCRIFSLQGPINLIFLSDKIFLYKEIHSSIFSHCLKGVRGGKLTAGYWKYAINGDFENGI